MRINKYSALYVILSSLLVILSLFYFCFRPVVQAQVNEVDMWADQKAFDFPYGTVDQGFGFIIPNSLDDAVVNELTSNYSTWGVYLKLKNPPQSILQSANFSKLSSNGFKWYFMFGDNNAAKSFITAYYVAFSNEAVVELTSFDSRFIQSLKQQFPSLKIHTRNFTNFDRGGFADVVSKTDPSYLDAISMKTSSDQTRHYDYIQVMFDTLFDAGEDIDGGTKIFANYKPGTRLSLSEVITNNDETWRSAYMAGVIESSIVSSIASSRINKTDIAPFRYTISKDITQMNAEEKQIAYYFADFLKRKPGLVWPKALGKFKTDHWENPIGNPWNAPNFSNSKPIVGVVGKIGSGYYAIFTNASDSSTTMKLIGSVPWAQYVSVTSQRGNINPVSGADLTFQPRETIVLYDPSISNSPAPTSVVNPTQQPTIQPTQQPTQGPIPTTQNNAPFKVVSFNVHGGRNDYEIKHLAQFIKNNNIDIIGMQEAGNDHETNNPRLSAELANLGYPMDYRYHDGTTTDLALFSRYKIKSYDQPEDRLQKYIIDITGYGDLVVFNWHAVHRFDACSSTRSMLFPSLNSLNNNKHLILGDYNMTIDRNDSSYYPQECNNSGQCEERRSCLDRFNDNYSINCLGRQCPRSTKGGTQPIDYIIVHKDSGLTILNSKVDSTWRLNSSQETEAFSDHFPVLTDISFGNTNVTPVITSSPPVCGNYRSPQFTNPQGSVVSPGTPYNITWTVPTGATRFHLRINDTSDSWKNNCSVTQFGNDVCVDNLNKNTFSYSFLPGHSYAIWVHADGQCGYSDAGSTIIYASTESTKCTIQGYKQVMNASGGDPSVESVPIGVENSAKTVSYFSSANPYFFEVPGNGDYIVQSSQPAGYFISSTSCLNKTDCHNQTDGSIEAGNSRTIRCPAGGFVDLWWHYKPESACMQPDSPTITSVLQPYGSGANVSMATAYWDYVDFSAVPVHFKVELSVDNQQTWSTIAGSYTAKYYSTYVGIDEKACYRVTAINSCGRAGKPSQVVCAGELPAPTSAPLDIPTPTLLPTTADLRCYGTQHCTDGNAVEFAYCGSCPGCKNGFTCSSSNFRCETYPGKKFFFDNSYPIDCTLLTPTPEIALEGYLATCDKCPASKPYLCTGKNGGYPFCWENLAPKSSYDCLKCAVRTNITNSSSNLLERSNSLIQSERSKIGSKLERVTMSWSPFNKGFTKLLISFDGKKWDTKLSGKEAYPYNTYVTTVTDVVDKEIFVRLSNVVPDGSEDSIIEEVISPESYKSRKIEPTPDTSTLNKSKVVLAVGGVVLGVVVPMLMLGI